MEKKNRYSSSLKVGALTLAALSILIFTVLWIKGRSLSAGERIDVAFKDINGMRAGSAVQMMGLRIGQIEEITPVIKGRDSYVNIRFVITQKGLKIPEASSISIQQSGIIGEQFLEVTPPKPETIYLETAHTSTNIKNDDIIYMTLSEGEKAIGRVLGADVVKRSQVPYDIMQKISTPNVLKITYYIDLPGLILSSNFLSAKLDAGKLFFYLPDGEILPTPDPTLKYTVVEPLRLTEFMNIGFRATKAMLSTNDRINEILSDNFIEDMKTSVENIRTLTASANTTLDKASVLIDTSRQEIESVIKESQELISSLTTLSNNLNEIVSNETIKNDVLTSIKSIGKMSDNVNKILEDNQTREIIADIEDTMHNLAEISGYINEFTKDEKLKEEINETVLNLANITKNISNVMNDYNSLDDKEKLKLKSTIKDILVITQNVKKFSQKLNKRFLLFRLMF